MAYGLRTSILVLLAAGVLGWALPRHILISVIQGIQPFSRTLVSLAVERPNMVLALIWIVALVLMVYMTVLVRHYGVNTPTLDDWAMAPLIVKAHTGQLRFADIFQQQQEARTFLPNLIFILSAQNDWNVRDQMLVSFVSSAVTVAGLFALLRHAGLQLAATDPFFWLLSLARLFPAAFDAWR